MNKPRFVIGIDVGGTFTDLLAYDESEGRLLSAKVPSMPGAQWQGVLDALEVLEIELSNITGRPLRPTRCLSEKAQKRPL